MCCGSEKGSYLRLMDLCHSTLGLRVIKKKKKKKKKKEKSNNAASFDAAPRFYCAIQSTMLVLK